MLLSFVDGGVSAIVVSGVPGGDFRFFPTSFLCLDSFVSDWLALPEGLTSDRYEGALKSGSLRQGYTLSS